MGMGNVLLLHTTEAAHYVTNDKKKKPCTYKIYDFTKGGIVIPDQSMGYLNFKQKTRNLTLVTLAYVLDMNIVNSQTKNFEFG